MPVCLCVCVPVWLHQSVVDGDFCERFTALSAAKQKAIVEELDTAEGSTDVIRKLEDTRNKIV